MHVLVVEVRVKPGMNEKFLEVLHDDATHTEADEPGNLRFDFLQDVDDPQKFYYYEVYKDEAAIQAHRESPHYARYAAVIGDLLDGPVVRHLAKNVYPADANWR